MELIGDSWRPTKEETAATARAMRLIELERQPGWFDLLVAIEARCEAALIEIRDADSAEPQKVVDAVRNWRERERLLAEVRIEIQNAKILVDQMKEYDGNRTERRENPAD